MKKVTYILLLAAALVVFTLAPAYTQDKAPETYSFETFLEETKLFKVKPFDSDLLEFEIRLPKDWEEQPMEYNRRQVATTLTLDDIAKFYGPAKGDVRPFARIQIIEITHDILAKDWIKNHLFKSGYVPMKEIESGDEKTAYATYVAEIGPTRYLLTSAVQIHRDWAVVAQFAIPVKYITSFRNLPDLAVRSFKMLNPPDGETEDKRNFSLLSALKFSYPSSWTISNPDFADPNRPSVELHNKPPPAFDHKGKEINSDRLDGLIRLVAVRKTEGVSLKTELIRLRKKIEGQYNLRLLSLRDTLPLGRNQRFVFGRQELYNIDFETQLVRQDLWFTVLEDEEYYIFIYMLTPKEDEIFYQWARNTLTYKKIIEGLE